MKSKLCFKTLEGYLFIRPDDINFIKAEEMYAYIYNGTSKHFVSSSLKSLEQKISLESFIRCHRSYLVNIDKVSKFIRKDNAKLMMENGIEVPISRNRKTEVMEKLGIE